MTVPSANVCVTEVGEGLKLKAERVLGAGCAVVMLCDPLKGAIDIVLTKWVWALELGIDIVPIDIVPTKWLWRLEGSVDIVPIDIVPTK